MEDHTKEVFELIDAIYTTVKLLGYDIVTEHFSNKHESRFLVFDTEEKRIALSYNHCRLCTFFDKKETIITDEQGLLLQTSLLKQIMEEL